MEKKTFRIGGKIILRPVVPKLFSLKTHICKEYFASRSSK